MRSRHNVKFSERKPNRVTAKGKQFFSRAYVQLIFFALLIGGCTVGINLTFLRGGAAEEENPRTPTREPEVVHTFATVETAVEPLPVTVEERMETPPVLLEEKTPEEKDHLSCREWDCTCEGAAKKYHIDHEVSWGSSPQKTKDWWVAHDCKVRAVGSVGAQAQPVKYSLQPGREGVKRITLQEMENMMAQTPESPDLASCTTDGNTEWFDRDIWVHVHSPWHLFFQTNESLRDNLNIQYVNDQSLYDKIHEGSQQRELFPETPNLQQLSRDQPYLSPGGSPAASQNRRHDGSSSKFRLHRLQFDLRDLYSPQFYFFGNKRFCNMFQFSGKLMWERQKMDCIGIPHRKDFQCVEALEFDAIVSNTRATLDEVRVWYPDSNSEIVAEVEVVTARNVILQKGDIIACEERMIQRESCAYVARSTIYAKQAFQASNPLVVDKLLVAAQSFGYYHFVAESLPRLAFFYDALMEDPSIKILIAHPAPYVDAFLDFLKIDKERVVYHAGANTGTIFAKQVWDTEATFCTCPRRFPLVKLREVFLGQIKEDIVPFKKKHVLMVQRVGSGGERRNITNFADVLAKVQEMMVTEFPDEVLVHWTGEGDTASVNEYSKLFANAKVVFGSMGAGLTNSVFMEPGAAMIEVSACGRLLYIHQSNALGLRHYGYCHEKQWKTWHWADPDDVANLIRQYLKSFEAEDYDQLTLR